MSYIIIDLQTGLMDGFYFDKSLAKEMAEYFNATYSGKKWIACEVVGSVGHTGIPNHLFQGSYLINKTREECKETREAAIRQRCLELDEIFGAQE